MSMPFRLLLPGTATSGVYFDMAAFGIDYNFKNNVMVSNEASRTVGSPYWFRLSQHTYQGHATPSIKISGHIDPNLPDPTYQEGFPLITLGWLGSISRAAGSVAYGRNTFVEQFIGSRTGNAPGAGSFSVIVGDVDWHLDTSYLNQGSPYLINYSMTLLETRDRDS